MVTAEDDDTLFTLVSPEAAGPVDRVTLRRQTLAGVLLLLVAAGAAWLLPAVLTDGPPQSSDTVLLADGEPHDAETSAKRTSMLWFDESGLDPSCVLRDGATGETLSTQPADGTDQRFRDSTGDWVGAATFAPTSESVVVTCKGSSGSVLVSQAPGGSAGLVAIGAVILIPLTLGMAGLVLLAAAATSLVQARAATGRR